MLLHPAEPTAARWLDRRSTVSNDENALPLPGRSATPIRVAGVLRIAQSESAAETAVPAARCSLREPGRVTQDYRFDPFLARTSKHASVISRASRNPRLWPARGRCSSEWKQGAQPPHPLALGCPMMGVANPMPEWLTTEHAVARESRPRAAPGRLRRASARRRSPITETR